MRNRPGYLGKALRMLPCAALAALYGCAPPCNGNIECTVLYAKPGPHGGRSIYVNVLNKPGLGIKKTLLWDGKEFGTFEHVAIISDPQNKYAANRQICFTAYHQGAPETGSDLNDEGIPRVVIH